jgi:hypothetical protein
MPTVKPTNLIAGQALSPSRGKSSFRNWAAERTNFPAEVAEVALAHTVSDKTAAWATFCTAPDQKAQTSR